MELNGYHPKSADTVIKTSAFEQIEATYKHLQRRHLFGNKALLVCDPITKEIAGDKVDNHLQDFKNFFT